ncbi:MAG: Snf7 family protein, partial [Candidatus Heimdallarchaeota archaeon]|nr:Snf7 family protein [Candidatus Heimdallarchaeota archaeon]MCK5050071.1 Snf7 family protein [Candidatus Heimdallarchaeota archaeon]
VVSRKLERSQRKLESKERRSQNKIRTAVQRGDNESARMYAKDLVRSRKWARGYQSLISKIDALTFKMERAEAVQTIATEMASVASALRSANFNLNLPEIDMVVNDMETNMEEFDTTTEIMEDGIDGIFAADTDDVEVDSILQEFGAEVEVSVGTTLPTPRVKTDKLQEQIDALREDDD